MIICLTVYLTLILTAEIHARINDNAGRTVVRRAIDGTRGRKHYEPEYDDSFYQSYDEDTDFSEFRNNVPGEPGIDYPSFTRIPQTRFTCEKDFRGYYADEEAGCQLFHVCDSSFLVSSFLCPVGSTFSQKLLTCDWWNKVDCSTTKNFYAANSESLISEVDDDEILRKAYEMTSLQSIRNGISIDPQARINGMQSRNSRDNDIAPDGQVNSDYDSKQSRISHPLYKYSSRYSAALDLHDRDIDYYPAPLDDKPSVKVYSHGKEENSDSANQYAGFQVSYAPTVPTVTTTTRKYYSPTIPSVVRTTLRSKPDLEFESSDHLYSAKGKKNVGNTEKNGDYVENIDSTPSPRIIQQFRTSESPLEGGVSRDESKFESQNASDVARDIVHPKTLPSVVFLPPFFYYSTVEQHESVIDQQKALVNLTAKPSVENSHDVTTAKYVVELTTMSPEEFNTPLGDIAEGESSPFHITVTVNKDEELHPSRDLLRSLIAQQDSSSVDQIGDIEIVQSQGAKDFDGPPAPAESNVEEGKDFDYFAIGLGRGRNINNVPRPFSLQANSRDIESANNSSAKALPSTEIPSGVGKSDNYKENNNTREDGVNDKKRRIVEHLAQMFGDDTADNNDPAFALPSRDRAVEFLTGTPSNLQADTGDKDSGDDAVDDERDKEKFIIETELVPSLGFALNTAEDREQYADAIVRGLLRDTPEIEMSTKSEREES